MIGMYAIIATALIAQGRHTQDRRECRRVSPVPRGGWSRPSGNARWALVSARAEGISIRTLAAAIGLAF